MRLVGLEMTDSNNGKTCLPALIISFSAAWILTTCDCFLHDIAESAIGVARHRSDASNDGLTVKTPTHTSGKETNAKLYSGIQNLLTALERELPPKIKMTALR